MGAGYHGGFGKTNGDKTHQKNLETTKRLTISIWKQNYQKILSRNI